MGSRFYFGDDSGSDLDDESLPFPKPLTRSAFLQDDFDPSDFLAGLSNRYQTLEDLGNELRALSQSLSKELLDLVNDNCQDYLNLGTTLQGGEDRLEEVRLGLLSGQRDLISIRDNVAQRQAKVSALIQEKRHLAKSVQTGNALMDFEQLLEDLEAVLLLRPQENGAEVHDQDIFDEGEEIKGEDMLLTRLDRQVEQFLILKMLMRRHQPEQPYILAQRDRLAKVMSTLLLDLNEAVKQLQVAGDGQATDSRIQRAKRMIQAVAQD